MKKYFSQIYSITLAFPQMETGFIIGMIQMLRMNDYQVEVNGSLTGIDFGNDVIILIKNPPKREVTETDESQFVNVIELLNHNFNIQASTMKRVNFKFTSPIPQIKKINLIMAIGVY